MNFLRLSEFYVEIPSVQFVVVCKDPDNNANSLRCLLFLIFKFFYVWHQKTTCKHFLCHSGEKLLHEEIFCVLGSERVLVLVEGGGQYQFCGLCNSWHFPLDLQLYSLLSHQKGSLLLLLLVMKQQTGITTYFMLPQKGKRDIMFCRERFKVWSRWLLSS